MTTTPLVPINTFQDILEALERHPPLREALRSHLLGEEFLRLPEVVANLAATVEQILGVITAMSERQARTEADVAELKAGQAILTEQVNNLNGTVNRLDGTVTEMQGEFTEVKGTVNRLEGTVNRLDDTVNRLDDTVNRLEDTVNRLEDTVTEMKASTEADIAELKDGQAVLTEQVDNLNGTVSGMQGTVNRLEGAMTEVQGNMNTMRGTLNRLDGTDYERTAARRIRRSGGRRLGLTRPVIVRSRTLPENDIIPSLLDDAIDNGLISEEQADEVDYADIIARGNDPDGVLTYVVAEVSITVERHDVTRARARADLMAQAANAPALAAVIGTEITDDAQRATGALNVAYISIPLPE